MNNIIATGVIIFAFSMSIIGLYYLHKGEAR